MVLFWRVIIMKISENIRKLRKEAHLTQKKLAEKTGLSEVTIRRYEADVFKPKYAHALALSNALNAPLNMFLDSQMNQVINQKARSSLTKKAEIALTIAAGILGTNLKDGLSHMSNDEAIKAIETIMNAKLLTKDQKLAVMTYLILIK